MGVDFYLHWEGQTEDENRAQITGFATVGDKGYIREAYGGNGEFATEAICPEAWSEAAFGPDEDLYGVLIVRSETDPPSRFVGRGCRSRSYARAGSQRWRLRVVATRTSTERRTLRRSATSSTSPIVWSARERRSGFTPATDPHRRRSDWSGDGERQIDAPKNGRAG